MLIPSSKTGADKYDLEIIDPNKVYPRIDARLLGENIKNLSEQTLGYSLSGDEGSSQAQVPLLSVIDTANIATYNKLLPQFISTLISNGNLLDVDAASTANSIILNPHNISPGLSPNGTDYSQAASLPFAYKDGLSFSFRATASNTAGVVLNIPLLAGAGGALQVLTEQETALPSGIIIANKYYTVVCKTIATVKKYILKQDFVTQATQAAVGVALLNKQITIANNIADPNNDIDFGAGNFTFSDFSGQAVASALTKRLDATWVAGTNQGGLDTGAKTLNTWYHCYAIYNPTTLVADFIFSTNATTPNLLPSGFTKFKRVGSIKTNSSNNILAFQQRKDYFEWKNVVLDLSLASVVATRTNFPISTPLGIEVIANIRAGSYVGVASDLTINLLSNYNNTLTPLSGDGQSNDSDIGSDITYVTSTNMQIATDSSSQISYIASRASALTLPLVVRTKGYYDYSIL